MDKTKERKNSLPHVRRLKTVRRSEKVDSGRVVKDDIQLATVLGLTVTNPSGLATSGLGVTAYPAGCVVVLANLAAGTQRHLVNEDRKTVTCLAWAGDSQHLATGESGHRPQVKVWSVSSLSTVATLSGHKFGVSCVAFTPSSQYVVSVGAEHDMTVNVWDWKNNTKVASNKISFHVRSISIASDGSYFVAVGNRHIKFWYVEKTKRGSIGSRGTVPLTGRSAILGEKRTNNFLDVAFGKGEMINTIFAITKSGLLCQLNDQRLLEKWVELKVKSAATLCAGLQFILVGCSEGIIRCFSATSLQYICSLPRPEVAPVPDIVAMSLEETHSSLSVVYSDHSLVTWDVTDVTNASVLTSANFHSSCIWTVDTFQGGLGSGSCLVTGSDDDTIRVWSMDHGPLANSSLECHLQKILSLRSEEGGQEEREDTKTGIKCVKVSPDENYIASGDRSGNIRVHDARTYSELCRIEAHDAEVTSLGFAGDRFLASASRDRLVHMFDVYNNFEFLTTVDEHSSVVTSVDFLTVGEDDILVSSGADRSIISRKVSADKEGGISLSRSQHIICKTVPYDMALGAGQGQILTACQDRAVRVFSATSHKDKPRILRGSTSEDGTLYRMTLDRSESYFAASCSDKTICVYNLQSGELVGSLCGHADLVTGLVFSHDTRHLVTVSGDSCIFVWKLPKKMSQTMAAKLNITLYEESLCSTKECNLDEEFGSPTQDFLQARSSLSPDAAYRFSVGKLPVWARKKVVTEHEVTRSTSDGVQSPQGKWAASGLSAGRDNDEGGNILDRFEAEDEEPDIGSVDNTKKLLFQTEDTEGVEFMVNAIDADSLRKSQKELNLPTGTEDLDTSVTEKEDPKAGSGSKETCISSLNFSEADICRKTSSISNAWREGTTPVQQRKNAVSIGKLLATNQLHSLLKNVTPEKSPACVSTNLAAVDLEKSRLKDQPNLTDHRKPKLLSPSPRSSVDSKTGALSRDLIKDAVTQVKTATDQLLVLFKRVSLDDDLDDNLRQELVTMMAGGAGASMDTLRLVAAPAPGLEDSRSKEEIRSSALENIRRFMKKNSKSEEYEDKVTKI